MAQTRILMTLTEIELTSQTSCYSYLLDALSCKEIPDSTWAWIGFHFATHCNADQRTRNAATRCVLPAFNPAKCDCGRGSAPDPAGGAYSAPPGPLAGFKGAPSRRGGGGEGRRGAGRERKGRELTLMRSWNRTADWLRPALHLLMPITQIFGVTTRSSVFTHALDSLL